jgi:hypothetical protein
MKHPIYQQLSDESRHFLHHDARIAAPDPDGVAFIFEDIKWYRHYDKEIDKLYSDLAPQDIEDYIVIEACPEYPSDESAGDEGVWWDNPWGFRKEINVTIEGV